MAQRYNKFCKNGSNASFIWRGENTRARARTHMHMVNSKAFSDEGKEVWKEKTTCLLPVWARRDKLFNT